MDVFEKEMQADNEEIAQLSIEEQKHLPDQPSSLDLDNLSLTSSRQSEAANKVNMANPNPNPNPDPDPDAGPDPDPDPDPDPNPNPNPNPNP